jgi:hypothetical protein
MRKLVSTILLLLAGAAAPLIAQTQTTPFPNPITYASAFGAWAIQGQSPNTYTFQGRSICNQSAQNTPFFAFNTNAPVWIADQTTSNSEVVTPSAIVQTAGSCGVSVSPSNQHYTFSLKSATGGLQEAINALGGASSVPALVQLDRNFYAYANQVPGTSAAAIITAAKGNIGVMLQDITTVPYVNYVWNGTTYGNSTWVNTKPVPTTGAAAGTSPTITSVGTALGGTVTVTTGTSTTTGTLFILTSAANTVTYLPTCNIGNPAGTFTTFTVAGSLSGSQGVCTITATSAPTASTTYKFTYGLK